MESNGQPDGHNVWPPPDPGVYRSSPQPFAAPNQGMQSFPPMPNAQLADSQFQQVVQGAYHLAGQQEIFQPAQSSYERISPVDDFSASSSSNATLRQFQAIAAAADGGQVIRLPPGTQVVTGYSMQMLLDQSRHHAAVASGVAAMSSGLPQPMPGPSRVLSPEDNPVTQSGLAVAREHGEPSQTTPLLQVVTAIQQFSQAESTSSEAIPLVVHSDSEANQAVSSLGLAIDGQPVDHKSSPGMDSFANEPDTTQDDNGPTFGHVHHSHRHHMASDFPEAESSQLDLSSAEAEKSDLDGRLDSPMSHAVRHMSNEVAPTMDATMDSTVEDNTLVAMAAATEDSYHDSRHALTMEPSVDSTIHTTTNLMAQPMEAHNGGFGVELVTAGPSGVLMSAHANHDVGDDDEDEDDDSDDDDDDDEVSVDIEENKENMQAPRREVRKSGRLASLERGPHVPQKPKYVSRPYNPYELWCEECQAAYATECPRHRQQVVYDKVVLSRAWASLPPQLQIFRLGETSELGVFAKKQILRRTQFGPYIGELVDSQDKVSNSFVLQLDKDGGEVAFFESTDENKCNWMMFVRPAHNYAEQNLVAYQYGGDIFFSTIKNIEAKQELKVWYAAHYAERLGVATHEQLDMENDEDRWPCYECNKRFRSSALLQKHLAIHDDLIPGGPGLLDGDDDYKEKKFSRKHRRKGIPMRASEDGTSVKRGRGRPKKLKDGDTMASKPGSSALQAWKKKRTTFYLNRLKQNKRRTEVGDSGKCAIKSLYKRKGKESGGNEWVCMHCDLTFNNASLLNLHTLTHAAEDVGLQEIQKFTTNIPMPINIAENGEVPAANGDQISFEMNNVVELGETNLECPVCRKQFTNKRDLIQHASEHGKAKRRSLNPNKPYKCDKCWKAFSVHERLQKHMLCHGDDDSKPLQCEVCFKRFMNNSALSCHLKTHSDKKYYECPICHEGFDQILLLKSHVLLHCNNGIYTCPECAKSFEDYHSIRKHMRSFHSEKRYPCPDCDKVFPRPDKLKLHQLRHSSHREFMCENCGRQFKRKDKLREHMKRMHTAEREAKLLTKQPKSPSSKKFVPKVSPTDYQRFIYKCHTCLLGFKRRGMLVNHLAKRHPDIKPESVPELNLPILKTQRDYYCQYCEKVYKSSSKRKAHILKNHPGAELPASGRKKGLVTDLAGLHSATFSQTVGSITTMPHPCEFCHKQYASKAKLLQHQRKKHQDVVPHLALKRPLMLQEAQKAEIIIRPMVAATDRFDTNEAMAAPQQQTETLQAADLLTQAMSELTQTLSEYRPQVGEFQIAPRIAHTGPASLIQAAPGQQTATTIELSHLGQSLAHTHFTAQPAQIQTLQQVQAAVPTSQNLSPQSLVATSQAQQPITITTQTFIPRTWASTSNFPNYR